MHWEERKNLDSKIQFKVFHHEGWDLDKSWNLGKEENIRRASLVRGENSISILECWRMLMNECYPRDENFRIYKADFARSATPLWKYAEELGKTLWLNMEEVEQIRDYSVFSEDQLQQLGVSRNELVKETAC